MSPIQHLYTSVACNRTSEIIDWNTLSGEICYGASHAILINQHGLSNTSTLKTLCHHTSQVNCVKWILNSNGESVIVSTSNDKTLGIWTKLIDTWTISHELKGHNDAVTCADGAYFDDELVVCSASVDSTVKFWIRSNGEFSCVQTLELGSGICIALKVAKLPFVNKPLILLALDDDKIHLFVDTQGDGGGDSEGHFIKVCVLSGHENWVRGIDVLHYDNDSILIATSSQDTYIRLWKIQLYREENVDPHVLRVESKKFAAYAKEWTYELESVLAGHEGWVYSVKWQPKLEGSEKNTSRLLSASLDKTLIIWEQESNKREEQAWVEKVRLGEVGGNGLGFYGACFGPNGNSVVAHGYNGSFHIWRHDEESGDWLRSPVLGGHFNDVVDVRWEPKHGRYLISCSTDQTTRLHAPWVNTKNVKKSIEWHEIARPQVHGYDMSCLTVLNETTFVSGAEEKVLRVFQAPNNFLENFESITGHKLDVTKDHYAPEGASVPSLGLSNKAVYSEHQDTVVKTEELHTHFVSVHLTEPPTEETLMQNTLWVEVQKLYGHGYEVFALDSSPDGAFLASASRATSLEHAALIIWDAKKWQQTQKLHSHNLTVTQLAFSPDSKRLLSVSRDRRWSLYVREGDSWTLEACTDKTNGVHSRIIWCCAWSHDSNLFATGSRDGKLCVWGESNEVTIQTSLRQYGLVGSPLEVPKTSITAVCFAPRIDIHLIAVGFESGLIDLYTFHRDAHNPWITIAKLNKNDAHHLSVRRLCFRQGGKNNEEQDSLELASCGNDRFVRIYSVLLKH